MEYYRTKYSKSMVYHKECIHSPTLFLVAVNNIKQYITVNVTFSLFENDHIIYTNDNNIKTIKNGLEETINNLIKWTNTNGFNFLSFKTKSVYFCKLKKKHRDIQ